MKGHVIKDKYSKL